jgi:hypothetical protein
VASLSTSTLVSMQQEAALSAPQQRLTVKTTTDFPFAAELETQESVTVDHHMQVILISLPFWTDDDVCIAYIRLATFVFRFSGLVSSGVLVLTASRLIALVASRDSTLEPVFDVPLEEIKFVNSLNK